MQFIILLFQITSSTMYDSVSLANQYYPSSVKAGGKRTTTVTFNKQFTNIPQVAIFPQTYDIGVSIEFNFTISGITTTKFDFNINCLYGSLGQFGFYWRAIDDSRITVISSFNTNISSLGSTTLVFPHTNPYATQGIVTALNIGHWGDFYFKLEVLTITKQQVTVGLTQNTSMLSLGFQIILGTPSTFIADTPVTKYNFVKTSPDYQYINLQQNTINNLFDITIVPLEGYQLFIGLSAFYEQLQSYGIRLDLNQLTNNNNTVSYVIRTWYYTRIGSLTYQLIWMNTKTFSPLQLVKMRICKMFKMDTSYINIKLQIKELNLIYSTPGTYLVNIDSSMQKINLIVQIQCYVGLKIISSILKCPTCQIINQNWQQYCYEDINLISNYITLYQFDQTNQQIKIDVTTTELKITQSDIYSDGSIIYQVLSLVVQNVIQ